MLLVIDVMSGMTDKVKSLLMTWGKTVGIIILIALAVAIGISGIARLISRDKPEKD